MGDHQQQKPERTRPNWITLSVLGVAASIGLYVFTIGSELGAMRQKLDTDEFRITALEQHGSGPVQTAAARVEAVAQRADRILTELLLMQQRISELAATQQTQGVILNRMQQDMQGRDKEKTP